MTPADDRLLAGFAVATRPRFASCIALHTPRLFAVTMRLLSRRADAEDAAQEAGCEPSAVSRVPAGVVVRDLAHRHRHSLRARDSPQAQIPPLVGSARSSQSTPPRICTVDLERAIAALPDGYRTVLVLHDIEGCTHEEIAALLEIEPGTSKSQLFHARRALRLRLQPVSEGVGK